MNEGRGRGRRGKAPIPNAGGNRQPFRPGMSRGALPLQPPRSPFNMPNPMGRGLLPFPRVSPGASAPFNNLRGSGSTASAPLGSRAPTFTGNKPAAPGMTSSMPFNPPTPSGRPMGSMPGGSAYGKGLLMPPASMFALEKIRQIEAEKEEEIKRQEAEIRRLREQCEAEKREVERLREEERRRKREEELKVEERRKREREEAMRMQRERDRLEREKEREREIEFMRKQAIRNIEMIQDRRQVVNHAGQGLPAHMDHKNIHGQHAMGHSVVIPNQQSYGEQFNALGQQGLTPPAQQQPYMTSQPDPYNPYAYVYSQHEAPAAQQPVQSYAQQTNYYQQANAYQGTQAYAAPQDSAYNAAYNAAPYQTQPGYEGQQSNPYVYDPQQPQMYNVNTNHAPYAPAPLPHTAYAQPSPATAMYSAGIAGGPQVYNQGSQGAGRGDARTFKYTNVR